MAGNALIEDKHSARMLGPSRSMSAAAVFDGHGGSDVSERLSQQLLDELDRRLLGSSACSTSAVFGMGPADSMSAALRQSFAACDADLLAGVEAGTMNVGCGACACCLLVDSTRFVVANTGDCGAVLIRESQCRGCRTMQAIPVTARHNADQPAERARLKEEHPDEIDIVICKRSHWKGTEEVLSSCYVKGILQTTRSFGDFYLKREELMSRSRQGRRALRRGCGLTPPYITSTPQVRVVLREAADHALVLGSDGFWDEMNGRDVARAMAKEDMQGLSAQAVADALLAEALARVATANGMEEAGLLAVSPGRLRRSMHDDITVLVVQL